MLLQKYKPRYFMDLAGRKKTTSQMQNFIAAKDIPNLLFHGPPGVGKTLSAELLAQGLFSKAKGENFFCLNASDETGIDTIRNKVKRWARMKTLSTDAPFKIIFLDEADFLSLNSQTALRRLMEDHFATCRFILSCNYLEKIIRPLQSRTLVVNFEPPTAKNVLIYLKRICRREKVKVGRSTLIAIAKRNGGDMRKSLNDLEYAINGGTFGSAPTNLLDRPWVQFRQDVYELDPSVVLQDFYATAIKEESFPMILQIAAADRDISRGATKVIQLTALFVQLQTIRDERKKK